MILDVVVTIHDEYLKIDVPDEIMNYDEDGDRIFEYIINETRKQLDKTELSFQVDY